MIPTLDLWTSIPEDHSVLFLKIVIYLLFKHVSIIAVFNHSVVNINYLIYFLAHVHTACKLYIYELKNFQVLFQRFSVKKPVIISLLNVIYLKTQLSSAQSERVT